MTANPPLVTLYSSPGCHLCDEARAGLRAMLDEGVRFELSEVDIESDPALHAAYLERIPVIEVGGECACELWLDRDAVIARVGTVSVMGNADQPADR